MVVSGRQFWKGEGGTLILTLNVTVSAGVVLFEKVLVRVTAFIPGDVYRF
jgi:hypothetical protein